MYDHSSELGQAVTAVSSDSKHRSQQRTLRQHRHVLAAAWLGAAFESAGAEVASETTRGRSALGPIVEAHERVQTKPRSREALSRNGLYDEWYRYVDFAKGWSVKFARIAIKGGHALNHRVRRPTTTRGSR